MMLPYPEWFYYPARNRPPGWVNGFVAAVSEARPSIDSAKVSALTSDKVLAELRAGLEAQGFRVEEGKTKVQRISLPVLFGENGSERVRYDVDAVHDDLGILVEVEAGRERGGTPYTVT